MIKFFRKIRQNSLMKNKTGKYLKYAIGEIVLVVIGILIALNVNNLNENRKKDAKIIEALKEIHRDLSEDIIESNGWISNYSREDSITNILMSKKMSVDDFKGFQGLMYVSTAASYYDLKINSNGYELLMENSDNIPEKYQALLKSLKKIYINDKGSLDESLKSSIDAIKDYIYHLKENTPWFNEVFYNNTLTPNAIEFFRNDSYFKNHLTQYYLLSIGNYYGDLYQFRIDAEKSYEELTNLLGLEDLVASDSTYHKIHAKDYEHFLGTYKEDTTNTVIISIESNKLFYQWNDREKVRLFPTTKGSFIHELDPSFNSIQLDSTGKTISHHWHTGKRQALMKKTD
tara:strand:+ start:82187 stop:83218 length:1032 start_codon:yes stop_codon:yes gene_type:complete